MSQYSSPFIPYICSGPMTGILYKAPVHAVKGGPCRLLPVLLRPLVAARYALRYWYSVSLLMPYSLASPAFFSPALARLHSSAARSALSDGFRPL